MYLPLNKKEKKIPHIRGPDKKGLLLRGATEDNSKIIFHITPLKIFCDPSLEQSH